MKVFPDTVTIPELKAWTNGRFALGIVTRLALSLREKCLSVWWSGRPVDDVD
jgi:hypothetical protein